MFFEKALDKLKDRAALAKGGTVIGRPGGLVEPGIKYYAKKVILTKDPQYIGDEKGSQRVIQIQNPNNKNYGKWRLKTSGKNKYFSTLKELETYRKKTAAEGVKSSARTRSQAALKNKPAYDAINTWTEQWITKNAPNYEVEDFNKFQNDFKKAWKKESKNKIYKGIVNTKNGFPNIGRIDTKVADPFSMYDLNPLQQIKLARGESQHRNFFAKIFYTNKKQKKTDLSQAFKDQFNFYNTNKRGIISRTTTPEQVKKIFGNYNDRRVVYMLTDESGMGNAVRSEVYTKFFGKDYEKYRDKTNASGAAYKKNKAIIKKKYGIDISAQLRKEQNYLKKILRVKELPPLMRYSADHLFGISQAAKSRDKKFAVQAVNNLVGMTSTQNRILGLGAFERERGSLIRKINNAPASQKPALVKELNNLMQTTYKEYMPNQKEFYALDKNKLTISSKFKPLPRRERVFGFAKQIANENSLSNLKQTFNNKEVYEAFADLKKGKNEKFLNLIENKKGGIGVLNSTFNSGLNLNKISEVFPEVTNFIKAFGGDTGQLIRKFGATKIGKVLGVLGLPAEILFLALDAQPAIRGDIEGFKRNLDETYGFIPGVSKAIGAKEYREELAEATDDPRVLTFLSQFEQQKKYNDLRNESIRLIEEIDQATQGGRLPPSGINLQKLERLRVIDNELRNITYKAGEQFDPDQGGIDAAKEGLKRMNIEQEAAQKQTILKGPRGGANPYYTNPLLDLPGQYQPNVYQQAVRQFGQDFVQDISSELAEEKKKQERGLDYYRDPKNLPEIQKTILDRTYPARYGTFKEGGLATLDEYKDYDKS